MPVTPTAASKPEAILFAGQSNMVRFGQFGEEAFKHGWAAAHPGKPVPTLLNCAVGGTYSGQWMPDGELFNKCVDMTKDYQVIELIHYQGESDAALQTTDWGKPFGLMVQGFRKIFGNIPVVFAQIAITTDPDFEKGWQSIKDDQASVHLPDVRMVRTDDISELQDTVHLTPDTYPRIAERFVEASK